MTDAGTATGTGADRPIGSVPAGAGAHRRSGGRELAVVLAGCVVGAALVLTASGRPWLTLRLAREAPLGDYVQARSGAAVEPVVRGLALVALAGVAALLATRRWGRVSVGALLTATGAGVVAGSLRYAAGVGRPRALALLQSHGGHVVGADARAALTVDTHLGWVIASVAGGLLVLAGGIGTLARSRGWPMMGARYDAPPGTDDMAVDRASTGASAPAALGRPRHGAATSGARSDRAVWDALDRGEDPTRDTVGAAGGADEPAGTAPAAGGTRRSGEHSAG